MKVVLYGSETCGKCGVLKKKLAQAEIDFDFVADESKVERALPDGWHIPFVVIGERTMNFADTCKWIKER